MSSKLRLVITTRDEGPRVFERTLPAAPVEDIEGAVSAGVIAFDVEFDKAITRARERHGEEASGDWLPDAA